MSEKSHTSSLHDMTPIEEGQTVGDVLPVFANVTREVTLGTPNPECAACRKPFNHARKRRRAVRMYPVDAPFPIAFSFDICGRCSALHQNGGADRDSVLAAVQAYGEGDEARQ